MDFFEHMLLSSHLGELGRRDLQQRLHDQFFPPDDAKPQSLAETRKASYDLWVDCRKALGQPIPTIMPNN